MKNKFLISVLVLTVVFMIPKFSFATTFTATPIDTDLYTDMQRQVDDRISGLSANNTTKSLWTTRGNLTSPWVWSTSTWTTKGPNGLDFSGASPWNSDGGYTKAGTLITPQHLLFANHYQIAVGKTVLFVAPDNTIATRTITAIQSPIGPDVAVAKLSSPLSSSFTYYPIVSTSTWEAYLRDGVDDLLPSQGSAPYLPTIKLDQEDHAVISVTSKSFLYNTSILYQDYYPSSNTQEGLFWEEMVGGDSGNPNFVIIGGQLVLVSENYFSADGTNLSYYRDQIENAVVALGGGYHLSDIDLSSYQALISLDPNSVMNVDEGAASSTVVGTVGITHNVDNATPYFSIISGNDDGAFSIVPSTGQVLVASSTLMDFAHVSPRTLGIKVEKNGLGGRASYTNTIISLNSRPYFISTSHNFSIDEHSTVGTTVGVVGAADYQNDVLAYSIDSGNSLGGFAINSSTGRLTVADSNVLNFTNNPTFNLVVNVQEANTVSHWFATTSVSVRLNDLSINFDNLSYDFSLDENTSPGASVGQVNATILDSAYTSKYYSINYDPSGGLFNIDHSTGFITVSDPSTFDFDTIDSYALSLGVSANSGSPTLSSSVALIKITAPSRPTIQFSNSTTYGNEGSTLSIPLVLSHAYNRDVSVLFSVTNISATNRLDFTLDIGSITISAGNTSGSVSVPLLADVLNESDELFKIILGNPVRASLDFIKNNTITIRNVYSPVSNSGSGSSSGGGGGKSVSTINTINTATSIKNTISSPYYSFSRNLTTGSSGEDVRSLQKFLNSKGFIVATKGVGSVGNETNFFGPATKKALIKFQKANGITPTVGYFGSVTRGVVKKL